MSRPTNNTRARRLHRFVGIALAAGVLVADRALAHGIVDQSHECSYQIFQIQYFSPVGQTFVPRRPNMTAVDVNLYDMNTPHSDTITMNLRQGSITGPIIATGSQFFQTPPTNFWAHYDFPPVSVVPGNTYVIELTATNVS